MTTASSKLPSAAHLLHFALLVVLVGAQFAAIYCGAYWITGHHAVRLRLYLPAELSIPLVPTMVVPYATMYLIFALAPFFLHTRSDLDRLASALARVIVVGGIAHVALPAQLGFPPTSSGTTIWASWLYWADRINLDYNMAPSLHVALHAACAGAYMPRVPVAGRLFLGLWIAAVSISTLLTHQHHVIDVVSGLALGVWGARVALDRRDAVSAGTNVAGWTEAEEATRCSR